MSKLADTLAGYLRARATDQAFWSKHLPAAIEALRRYAPTQEAASTRVIIIDPAVRAGFIAFSVKFEGKIGHMYRDVFGYVTTAIGVLIDPIDLALEIPWLKGDGSPASMAEVMHEWQRVYSLPKGKVASYYAGPLHISDATIDELTMKRFDANLVILQGYYPDIEHWPSPAQLAVCSMAWAMGAGFPVKYPKFSGHVRARRWLEAASECLISTVGRDGTRNAGIESRNAANTALLVEASNS